MQALSLAVSQPAEAETLAMLLDDAHVGHTCVVVSGTKAPDDVLDVAHLVSEAAEGSARVHAVVLASARPSSPLESEPDAQSDADIDRWLELLDLFDTVGLDLLDWFILSGGRARSMRNLTGMPPLWREA